MARNVEIKTRIGSLESAHRIAAQLSGTAAERIQQHDVFYPCANGRLKLRMFEGDRGELIQYHRPDTAEARVSDYVIAPTDRASLLAETLRRALGVLGEVKKTRWLYMVGQTRVHLDEVCGLGDFMELEVVLRPGQEESEGREIAEKLMLAFGIGPKDVIACAYIDLLLPGKGCTFA